MSNETSHSNESGNPAATNYVLTVVAAAGFFLVFSIIIFVAYIPNRPAPVDAALVKARTDRLAALRAKSTEVLTTYAVVDKDKGIVRIPVDRAMELTVQELKQTPTVK